MSDRTSKVGEVIKEAVATFIQREANTNPMITVTRVDMSPDLRNALIFFTTIPDGKEAEAQIFMKRNGTDMRNHLKKHARLKRIPNLTFMLDAGEKHRQHMDELVKTIEKK